MYEARTQGAKAAERDYRKNINAARKALELTYSSHELTAAINAYDARMAGLRAGVAK